MILVKPGDGLSNRGERIIKNRRSTKQNTNDEISEANLVKLIVESHKIEYLFSHYCDLILINDSIDKTVRLIIEEVRRLRNESQFVPADWLISEKEIKH